MQAPKARHFKDELLRYMAKISNNEYLIKQEAKSSHKPLSLFCKEGELCSQTNEYCIKQEALRKIRRSL